jgi:shikimate kinase
MGAGKSTVGKLLAHALGFEFVDTDVRLVRQFKKPIHKIFHEHGEAFFRSAERELLGQLSMLPRLVISTGGGTLANPNNLQQALERGRVIYLRAPVEVLYERVIFSPKDRPLLDVPDSEAIFRQRFYQREPFYQQAHHMVETTHKKPESIVSEILNMLKQE